MPLYPIYIHNQTTCIEFCEELFYYQEYSSYHNTIIAFLIIGIAGTVLGCGMCFKTARDMPKLNGRAEHMISRDIEVDDEKPKESKCKILTKKFSSAGIVFVTGLMSTAFMGVLLSQPSPFCGYACKRAQWLNITDAP